jgi:elongation factor Ts
MNNDLLRELRNLTAAGMKDCKDALEEAGGDLQKAVDIIKVKGLNIVSARAGKVAAEGLIDIVSFAPSRVSMVEVNCQTDFVANSQDFRVFVHNTGIRLAACAEEGHPFSADLMEAKRQEVVATTKENVVVRRWWLEEAMDPKVRVFSYLHSNQKIGVLITMSAPSEIAADSPEFKALGEDLAMQICAMNPLAVSPERISPDETERQKAIFETQLKEENKPEKMWDKILQGKFSKWYKDVCLLEQESVVVAKTTVKQVIANLGTKLGGDIEVINFVRCQVGEGIANKKDDLAEEVAKMTGITRAETPTDAFIRHVADKMKGAS